MRPIKNQCCDIVLKNKKCIDICINIYLFDPIWYNLWGNGKSGIGYR